jgi:hypothetical protein
MPVRFFDELYYAETDIIFGYDFIMLPSSTDDEGYEFQPEPFDIDYDYLVKMEDYRAEYLKKNSDKYFAPDNLFYQKAY